MNPSRGEHDLEPTPTGGAEDAALDANLRAVGSRVGRLPAPTPEQLASWRRAPAEATAPLQLADAHVPRARRSLPSRWLAAGSAIAACIAVAGVILVQPWGAQVQASTIIQNLRQRAFGGVNIRFEHLSAQGTTVDGVMRVRLSHPISLDRLDEEAARTPEQKREQFGAAWGSFVLTTDESPQAWPGLSGAHIQVEGALTHGSGWMYVQAPDKTARQLAQAEPRAAMLAQLAGSGVLLNIGGVDEAFFEGLNAMVCPTDCPGRAVPGLHAGVGPGKDGRTSVSVGAAASVPGHPSTDQVRRFVSLARMVLSGKARQEELEQLQSLLQNDFAQQATVQRLGGGAYLLKADVADPDHPSPDGRPEATLRVHYEEQGGVQWAELSNIRDATGAVRIEFATDPIDPKLLAYDRFVETGKTNYIDLRQIMKLLMPPPKPAG